MKITVKEVKEVKVVRMEGVEALWEDQLISRNEYVSEKSSLTDAYLSLRQSKHKLEELVRKSGNTEAKKCLT